MLISVVMDFSGLVLAEAVLSYVGVGVDPSMISFGTMINNARLEMAVEAARLMETHKISGLMVVDETGRAVGALNIHDLLRARVV